MHVTHNLPGITLSASMPCD